MAGVLHQLGFAGASSPHFSENAPNQMERIDPPIRQVDPHFYSCMQLACGSKKIPIKVTKEMIKWTRTVAFLSKEQLNRFADISNSLNEISGIYTRIALLPDTLFIVESLINMPGEFSDAFRTLDDDALATLFKVTHCAKKVFLDTLGPLFKSIGLLVTNLLDLEIVDLGQFVVPFKAGLALLLVTMSVKELGDCYFKYQKAHTEEKIQIASAKLVEKGADFAICALHFFNFSSIPALAITLLLLSTTKLFASIAKEYLSEYKHATPSRKDPELTLDTTLENRPV